MLSSFMKGTERLPRVCEDLNNFQIILDRLWQMERVIETKFQNGKLGYNRLFCIQFGAQTQGSCWITYCRNVCEDQSGFFLSRIPALTVFQSKEM